MRLLGIDPSRLVSGYVVANIVHVPEGTDCGQPYSISYAASRLEWQTALGYRHPLINIYGTAAKVSDETGVSQLQPSRIGQSYLMSLHKCLRWPYTTDQRSRKGKPRVMLIHRIATRSVKNFEQLRARCGGSNVLVMYL
jgi:hypothetical protein